MRKSANQSKKVFSVKRVRGGVPASSSLRAGRGGFDCHGKHIKSAE
jgi:hypothetical protein